MESSHREQSVSTYQQLPRLTICMFGHDVSDTHALVNYVVEMTMQHGVNLLHLDGGLVNSRHGFESQANIMYDLIDPDLIDGLMIEGVIFHYAGSEEMKRLCQRYASLPIVTQEVPIPGIPRTYINFYQGMYDILRHLIEVHQYRRIAFVRGPEESMTAGERYRAYCDALAHAGISIDDRLIAPGTFFEPSGQEAVRTFLDSRQLRPGIDVQAIVAVNDFTAFDVIKSLQGRGIRVPRDVAVTGFDNSEIGRLTTPPLTTARLSLEGVGRPLVELLLDQIAGKAVPEQVVHPAALVLRESCGCLDRAIVRAAATDTATRCDQPFERAVADRRAQILAALRQASGEIDACLPSFWAEQIFDAFTRLILSDASGEDALLKNHFWPTLDNLFQRSIACQKDTAVWHDVFSELRCRLLPCLSDPDCVARAENVWQQIRVKISRNMERVQRCQRFRAAQQARSLQEIEQTLLITFHIEELMDVLAAELPRVNIPACYLALYEEPQPYRYPQRPPEWSRLVVAYDENGRIALPAGGQRFRSSRILPDPLFCRESPYALDVWPLYFREAQLGFIIFDIKTSQNRSIYNTLRKQISNALQGALLVQQIKQHDAELTRKQYILDAFMANIPDRIYFKDRGGRITRANMAHAQRLGLNSPEDEIGKTDFDFFPEEEARRKSQQEQEILRTGRPLLNLEEYAPRPDGAESWSLTTKMPLRDERGEIIGTFGISRDITDLKHAEQQLLQYRDHLEEIVRDRTVELTRSNELLHKEILERTRAENALRASEQQYRLLAENVKDGIMIVQKNTIVFANSVLTTMLGISSEEYGETNPVSALCHSPALQRMQQLLREGPAAQPDSQWHVELLNRDGRQIWVEIQPSSIVWNSQPAFLMTIRDVTSQKIQEQRLEEERLRLEQENITLKSTIKERYRFGKLIGKSSSMQCVYELIMSAASSDVNVLICGESGTGKELIAETIHQVSPRKAQAFVAVNCASIPETLFEREFFGHRKGTFTGADRDKPGFFDRAHRGVLFLDEVTELSPGTQAKLLRVLQDGEYTPLGSNTPKQADVLIVAATNRDVPKEIAQGRLRKDFFYRICVIEMTVPPLRDRKDDLPLLVEHILEQYRQKQAQVHGRVPHDLPVDQTMLPGEFVQRMYAYHWPGNVRELENILQRYLATQELQAVLPSLDAPPRSVPLVSPLQRVLPPENSLRDLTFSEAVTALEIQLIREALEQTHYRIGKTAKRLGIPLRTLQYKMKKYQLRLSD
ncbi:MAG: sigma 54-interacting transcriptional regulator [Candidatus Vecturithrix sp.]|nr:sigma 54-interacting transcriptional regulator [Candidatus Vecturithrix sp.]